jgi:hypothetical protein
MTRNDSQAWLWSIGAVCGLLALAACQEPAQDSDPSEASAAAAKVASKATSAEATPAEATNTRSIPETVRSPKVTAPVDEIAFQGKRIAIVHTANVIGELEPCG